MSTYTADELKAITSIPEVSGMADARILMYQSIAETAIDSLILDDSLSGYTDARKGAIALLFDAVAQNPTGLTSKSQGKVSSNFTVDQMPFPVRILVAPFVRGSGGTLSGAQLKRSDIGLR